MKLLRLTLQGFKSFADRTTIEFSDGMTVIVGPNGCGKSNISDAVRWVLGEQNIRNLRGEKTEDIIFSGSETRKAKNAAEVTLVLDNSHHELPIDTVEVAITRRLLRSGESSYQINKRNCRLKDIQELLAQVGLGKGTMAIIGQNRVDQVLTARPEERRLIFEEVAGISLYRMRKNEGLKKLEKTEENMSRVQDLMAMMDEQLGTLKKEAEKAKNYHALLQRKNAIEATMLLLKMTSTQRMLARYENESRSLEDEVTKWKTALSSLSAKQAELEQKEAGHQDELRHIARDMSEREKKAEQARADYRVKEETLRHAEETAASLLDDLDDQTEAEKETQEEIASMKEELTKSEDLLREKTEELSRAEEEHRKAADKLKDSEEAYQKKLEINRKDLAAREYWLQEKKHASEETERLRAGLKEIQKTLGTLSAELAASRKQQEELEGKEKTLSDKMAALEKKGKEKSASLKAKEDEAFQKTRHGQQIESHLREITTRRQYLSRADQEYASFSRTAKTILENRDRFGSAIIGPVGDLIDVPGKYADAAEIALGASVSHIVTDTSASAAGIIQWLKENHLGRATFYPLEAVHPRGEARMEREAAREKGICGIAADLFQYDEKYKDLMEYLLGRTLIAENLDAARAVSRKYHYRIRIVTLDGQLVSAGGSMTGGSMRKKENTFFGRRQEIAELGEQEKQIRAGWEENKKECTALNESCATLSDEVEKDREEWQRMNAEKAALSGRKEGLLKTVALQENSLSQNQESEARTKESLDAAVKKAEKAEEKLTVYQSLEALPPNTEGAALKEKEQALSKKLMDRHVEKANAEKDVLFNRKNLKEREDYAKELSADRAALEKKIEEGKKQKEDLQNELSALDKKAQSLFEELDTVKSKQGNIQDAYDAFLIEKKKIDDAWKEAQSHSADAEKKLAEIQGRAENFKVQEQEVMGSLQEKHLTVVRAEELRLPGSMEDMKKKKSAVDVEIANLGTVNPNGVEAYELELRRRKSYEEQMDDLRKSEADLQKIVHGIDKTMSDQFGKAFVRINEEFSRVMQIMFPGGKARLELTDPDHPLEGGVEMYLQLPGKKRQPLSLMSGGERALTVVALLLSFMAYRPAPFCFVDEIDAALDDANVERYSRLIRDYKEKTQFIVISHRKKTMEYADTLQGVTMAEKGVSTLITVHMSDYFGKDDQP